VNEGNTLEAARKRGRKGEREDSDSWRERTKKMCGKNHRKQYGPCKGQREKERDIRGRIKEGVGKEEKGTLPLKGKKTQKSI